MKNRNNRRLLCLILTAAMLAQPAAVSAAGLQSVDDAPSVRQDIPAEDPAPVQADETLTEQPAVPAKEQPAVPAKEQPAGPAEEQPAAPAKEQPAGPAEGLSGTPAAASEADAAALSGAEQIPVQEQSGTPEEADVQPQETEEDGLQHEQTAPALQNGQAVIPSGSDADTVKLLLAEALIGSGDLAEEELLALEWEYSCEGKTKIGTWGNRSWGSVGGFTTETGKLVKTAYTHPALSENEDGSYQVRLAGTDAEVTLTKKSVLDSGIILKEGISVGLPYTEDRTVDYDQLIRKVYDAVVAETTPELTVDDICVEYYATAKSGSVGSMGKNWAPLGGGKVSGLEYPAITAGDHQIRFTWDGNGTYAACSAGTSVNIAEREEAPYIQKDPADSVKLPIREDLTVDYDALEALVFRAVIAESEVLTAENVTIEYYATAKSGSVGSMGKNWAPLGGGRISGLEYPGIPAGTHQIRISWPGSQTCAPTVITADVEVLDREQVQFSLKEGSCEVGMVFTAEQDYDYEATARAIYDALVVSVSPEVAYEEIRIEYNTDLTGLTHISYKPLGESDASGLVRFKDGKWEIRISCGDTVEYRGNAVTAEVTVSDHRLASAVVLKEGASFTYHMDPSVLEQAVFDQVIDWEASELPDKASLDVDDFEIQYKAQIDVLDNSFDAGKLSGLTSLIPGLEGIGGSLEDIAGSLNDSTRRWMPVEGGEYLGIPYAPMGAGEHSVRIRYRGNAEYRPSDAAEGTVTVRKANVKVRVHSDHIYADESLPEGFITTDPADQFDFYTVYTGATSNVNLGVCLDLPDKYDNNSLIRILDPVVEKIVGKSFTQMLQDGVTLGELRAMFDSTEVLELLDKTGVDTGAFGQILKAINAMPSAFDGMRISFGAPNRAGLYNVTVITDNKNYNTGVGMGTLLVKMRMSGVKLTWNEDLGSKISADKAREFDFGATLSRDGDVTISQDNVHYLYSGFTSRLRVYSSTTTPPTEPGRYVVTVVTLGGNYQAFPITRSFQITK